MKILKPRRSGAIALFLAICSIWVLAQSEKYLIRFIPKPKTTTTLKLVQDIDIDMSVEGGSGDPLAVPPQMKMLGKTLMAMTLKAGETSKEGLVPVVIVNDNISSEMSMNGAPITTSETSSPLQGKTFSVTYDAKGDIVELKIDPEFQIPEESLKEILRSALGAGPSTPMSIGESASNPLKMTLPIPIPNSGPLAMDGTVKTTLLSVEKSGADRIAKINLITEAKVVSSTNLPGPDGKELKMDLNVKMSGGGDSQLNLDQGKVKASDSLINIDGRIGLAGPDGKAIIFVVKGTIKVNVTGGS